MNWVQIIFSCTPLQSDVLEEGLLAAGALAITYRDGADQPLLEPAVGEMPLWDHIQFSALFNAGVDVQGLLQHLQQTLDFDLPAHRFELVEQKDWECAWMDHYQAMSFGERLWICPSWQEPPQPQAVNLMLDPGLAFGTGTHQTTSLCLQWLDAQDLHDKTVLDYGCGSGVLGIASLLLGARLLWAVDNDPQALVATRNNAARNGCADRVQAFTPQAYQGEQPVDVVLANILAGPLIELAPRLCRVLKPGAYIVLAGLLREQAEQVMQAYRPWIEFEAAVELEGWQRLVGQRQTR
jgi:ribosomal protein L11 methyltransferase